MSRNEMQEQFRNAGVVGVMLEVIDAHPNEVELLAKALKAIWSLAQDEITREEFVTAGACEKIVAVCQPHFENDELLEEYIRTTFVLMTSVDGSNRLLNAQQTIFTEEDYVKFLEKVALIYRDELEGAPLEETNLATEDVGEPENSASEEEKNDLNTT